MTRLPHGCASSRPSTPELFHGKPREERRSLRSSMRARRRAIRGKRRRMVARQWAQVASPMLLRRGRLALYMASAEELDVGVFLERACRRRREICLPVITGRRKPLIFRRASGRWVMNRHGIREPARGAPVRRARFLSVVVMPLVAFDAHGHRLGMGGGYYDRTMAHRRLRLVWKRPLLIGAAYACQQADQLPAMAWDIPLDAVVTEKGWQVMRKSMGYGARGRAAGDHHGA